MINDNDGPKRRTDTYTVSSGKSNNATVSTKTASALNSTQKDDSNARVVAAAAHAVVPNLANLVLMVFLILGGCCTNVSFCLFPYQYQQRGQFAWTSAKSIG
jgi:hypothetical protein